MLSNEQSGLLRAFATLKKWVDKLVAGVCISIVAAMTILVTYQVVVRYLFNSPSAVSEVLSRYLFIWLILIGSAYVFGLKEHMAISFVKEKFSAKAQIFVEMLIELVTVVFALAIMIFGGYNSAVRQMWQLDSALQIPMGVIYAAIPLSGALMVFYFLYNELQLASRLKQLHSSTGN
ncbi:TRAP-type C4-dicarboxylate transport system, small permease component [Vibrio xiamenensis]|uniref:TRAP transporter small permease protein n=1 Tax=Vibrio xiamenensis TaxID=861298 RepID=A0A1G8FUI9_9VIBR|nr:TRAP transporter small permease [Vibrio xiamenensis]SDH85793.1 TRAP-type C4-dicarboxylate transport system, small permease component [Vibrio xiamenensis]